jgi:hypothetical protein
MRSHLTPRAERARVTKDTLVVDLTDGRTLMIPLAWYPRLLNGSTAERNKCRLIGRGEGIHWADLDEDISIEALIAGLPSAESQQSFERWLSARARKRSRRLGPSGQKTRRA